MNCCTHQCNEGHDCHVRASRLDGTPLPLHRQVMPPEPSNDKPLLWLARTVVTLILLTFAGMCWLAYPNFPQ